MNWPLVMLIALVIEWSFGWPDGLYRRIGHPVTWIGRLISRLDRAWNRPDLDPGRNRIAGATAALLVVAAAVLPALAVTALLPDSLPGHLIAGLLAAPLIAARSLRDHVAAVGEPLVRGDLTGAQIAVSHIVGRDPESDSRKVHIVIDLSDQRARFIQDGEVVLSTRVSTGKKGNETKPGEYLVTFKHKDHRSNLYDAPMPFFLRLSCSDFGLHEGNVPGYPASHGCIRVPKKTAEKLFGMARLGDLVTIQE